MDHHTVATVSVCGICLDVLGGLYLAYDLLGGKHGPLRLLTRMVTYSLLYGIGFGLSLGLVFGISSGIAFGVTVGIELSRTARLNDHYPLRYEALFASIRSVGFSVGIFLVAGLAYAVAFGTLIALGQVGGYWRGLRPGAHYSPSRRPKLTREQLIAAVVRTGGYTAAAMLCSAFITHLEHPWHFATRLGLTTGILTAFGGALTPFVEYYVDNLPEKRLGVIGICIVFCGFVLQSVQYLIVIMDVPVT
jgi:hypothetical protein